VIFRACSGVFPIIFRFRVTQEELDNLELAFRGRANLDERIEGLSDALKREKEHPL
jgi:hypothetical protein